MSTAGLETYTENGNPGFNSSVDTVVLLGTFTTQYGASESSYTDEAIDGRPVFMFLKSTEVISEGDNNVNDLPYAFDIDRNTISWHWNNTDGKWGDRSVSISTSRVVKATYEYGVII